MSTQFSGTLIRELCDDVDRAMRDPFDHILRRANESPIIFLAQAETHLAGPNRSKKYPGTADTDTGDRGAYAICHDIQDCLFSGRPIPTYLICFGCGQPTMIYPAAEVSDILEYMKKSFLCDLCDGGY